MKILVTGVGGFVGTALVRRLAAAGESVVGTYLGAEPEVEGAKVVPADVLEPEALATVMAEVDPDAVVHLAGFSHVGESWERIAEYFQVNVIGVENLLAAAGDRRVLLASSAEVYGRVDESEQPIAEDRPLAPRNPYALTKAVAERLVLARGGIVVRMFNIIGRGQATTFALPSFARQLAAVAAGAPPVLEVGNLSARRDFVHIEDAIEAYLTLIRQGEPGGVYNLGTGRAVSIAEALDRLIAIAGVEVETRVDPDRFRPSDVELTSGDASRLRALGWHPAKTLDDALEGVWLEAVAEQPSHHAASRGSTCE